MFEEARLYKKVLKIQESYVGLKVAGRALQDTSRLSGATDTARIVNIWLNLRL